MIDIEKVIIEELYPQTIRYRDFVEQDIRIEEYTTIEDVRMEDNVVQRIKVEDSNTDA
jgi:hypothetical protein